jgi:hypothetical protein
VAKKYWSSSSPQNNQQDKKNEKKRQNIHLAPYNFGLVTIKPPELMNN